MKKNIFVALDFNSLEKAIDVTRKIKNYIAGVKIGTELYAICGVPGLKKIKEELGVEIFLDLKLNDIPTTCSAALKSLKDLKNINYITIHANSGEETIRTVVKSAKKINSKIKILLVTILTSISNSSVKKIGHTKPIRELVKKQASLAKLCGCHGIICAGSDLKFVKKIFKGEIITPGIRLKGDSVRDQKRVMGPKDAFKNGSSALVIGRSITRGNIKNNILKLIKEIE